MPAEMSLLFKSRLSLVFVQQNSTSVLLSQVAT